MISIVDTLPDVPAPGGHDSTNGVTGTRTSTVATPNTKSPGDPGKARSRRAPRSKPAAKEPAALSSVATIASAVYVTGTVGLTPGMRYSICHDTEQLKIMGPAVRGTRPVVFERPLAGIDAASPDDRFILSAPGPRGGIVLVFMSVDGDASAAAAALMRAATDGHTS